jgi:hypothetical protein
MFEVKGKDYFFGPGMFYEKLSILDVLFKKFRLAPSSPAQRTFLCKLMLVIIVEIPP